MSLQFVDLFNQNKCNSNNDDAAMLVLFKEECFLGAALGLVKAIIHKINKDCFYQFNEITERRS